MQSKSMKIAREDRQIDRQLYLLPVVRPDTEGRTLTGGESDLPVLPCLAVSPGLLNLTLGDRLPQSQELLRHLDVLDGRHGVVSLSLQN